MSDAPKSPDRSESSLLRGQRKIILEARTQFQNGLQAARISPRLEDLAGETKLLIESLAAILSKNQSVNNADWSPGVTPGLETLFIGFVHGESVVTLHTFADYPRPQDFLRNSKNLLQPLRNTTRTLWRDSNSLRRRQKLLLKPT